jgi:hypothetical protein
MNTGILTATPKAHEAFRSLRSTDFEFNALGRLSMSDAAFAVAVCRNRSPSNQISSKGIHPIPPWPWP